MQEDKKVAIRAENVTKIFGSGDQEVRALDNVSITINQNEFFTLLGPSGCGKTTLLRLIAGFEQPNAGEIWLDDQVLTGLPPHRRPVNTVFQSYALFPHMTVGQNIAFGLEMQGKGKQEIDSTVKEMLDLVHLGGMEMRTPAQLSGGQQQRVALARALANRPKVLLLDEPLSALDLKLRKGMQIELKRLQSETGITFVFVTHDQEEALTMSDRVAVMSSGQILQIGNPSEIYEHPQQRFVADFIGETNFLEAEVVDRAARRLRLDEGGEVTLAIDFSQETGQRVTLAVRPERAQLDKPNENATLKATVSTVVYFGTDTTYHLTLDGSGKPFTVRMQNRQGARRAFSAGDPVALLLPEDAIQVLKD
ncbi:MAG: ABC transporter ATP-binding protein [Rhodovibrionaceae bacterium]